MNRKLLFLVLAGWAFLTWGAISQASIITWVSTEEFSGNVNGGTVLDWAIAGGGRMSGGNMISTSGSGTSLIVTSATPGGTTLHFLESYPDFAFNGGSVIPAAYQYDAPAVDITVPVGTGTVAFWTGIGHSTAAYQVTLDNFDTGPVAYGAPTKWYKLTFNYNNDSGVDRVLRFKNNNTGGGGNVGLYAAAVVPEPSTVMLLGSGVVGLLAFAWRRRK